ncbi:MAG: helix-turn-helix transcriptional regulator [Pseudomonadota bacterium]
MPRTQYLKTEIYCDFVRHFDMGQPMVAIFGGSVDTIVNFIIHRPPSGEEYNDEDIKFLTALAPHLNRGLQMYRELEGLRGKAGLFEAAFDALGAAFLLDASGRVLMLNKGAGQLLEDGGVLSLIDGRLGARHAADDAVLAAAFAPSRPGAAPADIVLRGGAMAAGLQLAITPVKGRNIPLFASALHGERVAFMVTATALGPSLQNLMALHGLTRAEAEVTLLLSEGLRAPQIALHRETSIATVNTQLKQIYAKTGVDGQIALILKLLGR